MDAAVFDCERRIAAHRRFVGVLEVILELRAGRFCARRVRAEHFTARADDEQLVEPQRLRELGGAHTDRKSPLIEIAGFEPDQRAVDQRIMATERLGQERQTLELVRELAAEWFHGLRELLAKALLFAAPPSFTHAEAERENRSQAQSADGEQEALR
jgi:hypothetical protein